MHRMGSMGKTTILKIQLDEQGHLILPQGLIQCP